MKLCVALLAAVAVANAQLASFPLNDVHWYGEGRNGVLYTADIVIGTPPQPFTCLIDTATSDFWVLS